MIYQVHIVYKQGGRNENVIYDNFKLLLENDYVYSEMSQASNSYGDGLACKRIADIIEQGKEIRQTDL